MFQTNVVEKIKTHILYSVTLFENRAVCEIMWKNKVSRAGQGRATDGNVAHEHCMLDANAHNMQYLFLVHCPVNICFSLSNGHCSWSGLSKLLSLTIHNFNAVLTELPVTLFSCLPPQFQDLCPTHL